MRERTIGLVTCRDLPSLTEDDRLLIAAFERRGVRAEPVVWDDPRVGWPGFGALVLRSVWDYHLRLHEFLAWLAARERDGVRVFNPPAVVRWNAHKGYLLEIAAAGLPVLETVLVPRGADAFLARRMAAAGTTEAVIKPAVAASAFGAHRITSPPSPEDEGHFAGLLAQGDVLFQPLAPEVAAHGEWSFVFLGGEHSHSVLKKPAPGDFRVQSELGGTVSFEPAPQGLVAQARDLLRCAPESCLYARIDGIERAGSFVLMELELVEPVLFFAAEPGAADRLAELVLSS